MSMGVARLLHAGKAARSGAPQIDIGFQAQIEHGACVAVDHGNGLYIPNLLLLHGKADKFRAYGGSLLAKLGYFRAS